MTRRMMKTRWKFHFDTMRIDDFDYYLPEELIAQSPLTEGMPPGFLLYTGEMIRLNTDTSVTSLSICMKAIAWCLTTARFCPQGFVWQKGAEEP